NQPHDLLAGNEFRDLVLAHVNVFVAIGEYRAELVGFAIDFTGPPSAHVVDGSEGFLGGLVNRKGVREILIFHRFSPSRRKLGGTWPGPGAARRLRTAPHSLRVWSTPPL